MKNRTTDNNCGQSLVELGYNSIDEFYDLSAIGNKDVRDLEKENPNFLIFPKVLGEYKDAIEKSYIFSLDKEKLTTYNLMGFIGRNNTQLTITSRFAKDDKKDYFLHYMLQKVFLINLFRFDQRTNREDYIWDFLMYLFPYFLKKAYLQGLYKAYIRQNYNDANIKGTIDIKTHIVKNIPFMGKIAYTTREHSYDNNITQLIRHTIEHIKTHPYGDGILTIDSEVRDAISKFVFVTNNNYNKNDRQKVISANLHPVVHPYYTEYSTLQKLCLCILQYDKLSFGQEKDQVYGLLFDGAWLWEEYLNTILNECGFHHPCNNMSKNLFAIHLFSNTKSYIRYPDFWKTDFVLDAKYKNIDKTKIDRNDMHQLISYMYILKASKGGLVHPCRMNSNEVQLVPVGELSGYGGNVRLISIPIPQKAESFKNFITQMKEIEESLKKTITL